MLGRTANSQKLKYETPHVAAIELVEKMVYHYAALAVSHWLLEALVFALTAS